MLQLSKHSPFQHRVNNGLCRVAEIFHDCQWVVEHRFQSFRHGKQAGMELFDIDVLPA
jgi:hypothetical protein